MRGLVIFLCAFLGSGSAASITALDKTSKILHDDFYDLCDKENVKCAGAWAKSNTDGGTGACFPFRNCTEAFAMETNDGEESVFYMLAINNLAYMSIGFSADDRMGEDPVVACIRNDSEVTGALSYNVGHKNVQYDSNSDLKMLETKAEDDYIYCKFQINNTLAYANRRAVNDTEATSFYMLGAAGPVNDDGTLGRHSERFVADEMWKVSSGTATIVSSIMLSLIGYLVTKHF